MGSTQRRNAWLEQYERDLINGNFASRDDLNEDDIPSSVRRFRTIVVTLIGIPLVLFLLYALESAPV